MPDGPSSLLDAVERATRTGLAAIDATGRQHYVNPAFCAMVGWKAHELIGLRAPFPYWPPEEREAIQAAFERTVRGEVAPEGVQLRFMRKSGERFVVRLLLSPLAEGDGTHGWLASLYETADEKAERQRADRELLNALVDASGEGIIVADDEGVLRVFNAEAERQHGRSFADIAASSWGPTYGLQRMDGSPLPLDETPLYRALHGARIEEARWRVQRPDGTVRVLAGTATPPMAVRGAPVLDEKCEVMEWIGANQDISARIAQEKERDRLLRSEQTARAEAEAASRSKDEFLAMLGHELRNPLAPIVTALQLMKLRRSSPAPSRRRARSSSRSGSTSRCRSPLDSRWTEIWPGSRRSSETCSTTRPSTRRTAATSS